VCTLTPYVEDIDSLPKQEEGIDSLTTRIETKCINNMWMYILTCDDEYLRLLLNSSWVSCPILLGNGKIKKWKPSGCYKEVILTTSLHNYVELRMIFFFLRLGIRSKDRLIPREPIPPPTCGPCSNRSVPTEKS